MTLLVSEAAGAEAPTYTTSVELSHHRNADLERQALRFSIMAGRTEVNKIDPKLFARPSTNQSTAPALPPPQRPPHGSGSPQDRGPTQRHPYYNSGSGEPAESAYGVGTDTDRDEGHTPDSGEEQENGHDE
jgi:hypothetical protein